MAAIVASPKECCGLLLGQNLRVSNYLKANNVADNPERHFEIDPAVLIAAERAARCDGPDILGYFHSHPTGNTEPSTTDAKNAAPDGRIWLILNGSEASAWRAVEDGEIFDRFEPISLECKDA